MQKNGIIFDRQPIRDLSFWFDFQIKNFFNLSIFHAHNLIIWILILIFFYQILETISVNKKLNYILVCLYAYHPCLTVAVSWLSARKHLLSELYILAATYFFLKSRKDLNYKKISLIVFLYLLSCLSSPINIAWPVWLITYYIFIEKQKNRKILILTSALLGITLFIYILNTNYYNTIYLSQTQGITKYITNLDENLIALRINSIGASFFQSICPIWPTPAGYYPGSFKNIIGISLLVIFCFMIHKYTQKSKNKELWTWFLFSILPILVMNIKVTNLMGMDTYLLIPTLGIYVIISKILQENKWIYILSGCIFIFYIYNSHQVSYAFESEEKIWLLAQKNEETPHVIKSLAGIYLEKKDFAKSFELSIRLLAWNPNLQNTDILIAYSINEYNILSDNDKINYLNKALEKIPNGIYLNYLISKLYARENKWGLAFEHMMRINPKDFHSFNPKTSAVTGEFVYFCQKVEGVKSIRCQKIKEKIKEANLNLWNEEQYKKEILSDDEY